MAQKKNDKAAFDALRKDILNNSLHFLYIFFGEEWYLLDNSLDQMRRVLTSCGLAHFNHHRFDSASFTVEALSAAVDSLPAFSERTLIEVHDVDLFKLGDDAKQRLIQLLSDLPESVCLVIVYDTIAYAPDGRQKLASVIKQKARVVEFTTQEQSKLTKWIKAHFAQSGKTIDGATCQYLAFVTGASMTALNVEIEKLCLYIDGDTVTRDAIDAVVTPVPDAVAYKLTDHIASGDFNAAARVLSDLLGMREVPHKLIYSVTLTLRKLLAARLCLDHGLGDKKLMELCGIKFDFQARSLIASARKMTLDQCRLSVLKSAETAFAMNSGGEPEALLTELLTALALIRKGSTLC